MDVQIKIWNSLAVLRLHIARHSPDHFLKVYRKECFVKCSGLRWVCLMLLVPIPWANRVWALPFLTVLAPSERYHQQRGKRRLA